MLKKPQLWKMRCTRQFNLSKTEVIEDYDLISRSSGVPRLFLIERIRIYKIDKLLIIVKRKMGTGRSHMVYISFHKKFDISVNYREKSLLDTKILIGKRCSTKESETFNLQLQKEKSNNH